MWPEKRLETLREAMAKQAEVDGLLASMDVAAPAWGVKPTVRAELQHGPPPPFPLVSVFLARAHSRARAHAR